MLPVSNKTASRPRRPAGDETQLTGPPKPAGYPYFYPFSQIVDYLRLRFACVTDVRDSSTGLPARRHGADVSAAQGLRWPQGPMLSAEVPQRSEERRVGKECRSRWSPY